MATIVCPYPSLTPGSWLASATALGGNRIVPGIIATSPQTHLMIARLVIVTTFFT